jgi:hypothetical protein
MLLKAEDNAHFRGEIVEENVDVWAIYSIEGQVKGEAITQSDRRLFASEQEARAWLTGEADRRGFPDFQPKVRTAGPSA